MAPVYTAPGVGILLSLLFLPAYAQTTAPNLALGYPSKPIRMVVGFAGGGAAEIAARIVGQVYTERWGQQVIIDPRPGAGGNIASEVVAKSPPDGYTLLTCAFAFAVNPSLFAKLPFDTLKDFAPVSLFAYTANFLTVHPSVPARSVKEFIALAKAQPGQITFGSAGNGTASHLAGELMNSMAGIKLVTVQYKGIALVMTAMMSGEVDSGMLGISTMLPHVKSGRMRALGLTSAQRSRAMPNLATIAEQGVTGYDFGAWFGVYAPAATPAAVVRTLSDTITRALRDPAVAERFDKEGAVIVGGPPEALAKHVKAELALWAKVVKSAGLRID